MEVFIYVPVKNVYVFVSECVWVCNQSVLVLMSDKFLFDFLCICLCVFVCVCVYVSLSLCICVCVCVCVYLCFFRM